MRTSSRRGIIDWSALIIVMGAWSACGSPGYDEPAADIANAAQPVVVTNCTGAAIQQRLQPAGTCN